MYSISLLHMNEVYEQTLTSWSSVIGHPPGTRFESCILRDFSAHEVTAGEKAGTFSTFRFEDCRFESCDLSNVPIIGTHFRHVFFTDCKLVGLRWDTAEPIGFACVWRRCKMPYSVWEGVDLRSCQFDEVDLTEADFGHTQCQELDFHHCILTGAGWAGAHCDGVDFTTAISVSMNPTETSLKRAKFRADQLGGLLTQWKIEVSA